MARTIEEYLVITKVEPEKVYTKEEALRIMNEHTIGIYKGRVRLTEDKTFTGYEIADKLHTIEAVFIEGFEKAVEAIESEEAMKNQTVQKG